MDQRSSASGSSITMARNDGPFVLHTLLDEVPLSADGAVEGVKINCVDYLDQNLYVGTSASELLHFVRIPPDPADRAGRPTFILASRLKPAFAESGNSQPGVQQILLLPKVGKACVLCNWTVTFYSLPELSPVFGTTQVKNCNWVGGVDLNEPQDHDDDPSAGVFILLSLNRRIQVVRIGEVARAVKNIDVASTTISVRRDSIACVADARSYSLLDVDRQLRIPLMTISSLDDSQPAGEIGQAQDIAGSADGGILRSASAAQNRPLLSAGDPHGHARSTSLGGLLGGRSQSPRASDDRGVQESPAPTPSTSPRPSGEAQIPPPSSDKPLPAAPGAQLSHTKPTPVFLKPHIVSPTAEEFLIVTGTGPLEPGIGMFVNLDGDPTRPTVEFDRYPREIVVDGGSSDLSSSKLTLGEEEEGYVIASTTKDSVNGMRYGLEIQRWDTHGTEPEKAKWWLEADTTDKDEATTLGIRALIDAEATHFEEVIDKLCQRKFSPFSGSGLENPIFSPRSADSRTASSLERVTKERELFERDADSQEEDGLPEGWEADRDAEEEEFARRLANAHTRIAVWSGNRIWWAIRNPMLLRLEARLEAACEQRDAFNPAKLDRWAILTVLNSFRGQDPKSELEFVTFSYLRQRAGVLLLTSLLHATDAPFSDAELQALEEVLVDSSLDPRVVLSLVPGLRNEIVESRKGIWIFGGVKRTTESYLESEYFQKATRTNGNLDIKVMQFLRRFLAAWRKKKGFGSVADEAEVFRTVDAALMLVLLELDTKSPQGLAKKSSSVRSELYDVVDKGVDCFDRAAGLLETYHRLFVLSRLYQSRKMAGDVLATWRRIIEGERDDGGELCDGEMRVREYLTKISSQALVREYGIWLAARNPKLGVQVFAEDKGKAPKFEPAAVVAILREEAPNAVRYYLEHLVFGKGHTGYVNDLITYYLDVVIADLQSSQESRDAFAGTYTAYRALQAPKPTYRQFLTDNAPEDDEVWHSRLRLLQLLGGANHYDARSIRERIATLPDELLVPETIILDGRERRHEDAIRLLVHKLGDYDTAVSYCLGGGSSIYARPDGRRESMPTHDMQSRLFQAVLGEFLSIEDVSDQIEQTSALLERFGGWFDVEDVLALIPDEWSVDIVAGFLVTALRSITQERHETAVTKALSSAENLRVNHDLIVKMGQKGPSIEAPN